MNRLNDRELLKELELRFLQNEKTMQELHSLTLQLTQLNKKLEDSEALKSHFLSNIRNEIVNPFAAIIGLSNTVIHGNNFEPDYIKKILSLIFSEAFYLDFQLQNIFAAAEIEAGEAMLEIDRVNISSVIEQIISSFKNSSDKKNIEVVFEKQNSSQIHNFLTDQLKLKIIVSNILNNAIEHSSENSQIKIITEFNNSFLIIRIIDKGEGISKDIEKNIFDRFKKGDSRINTLNKGHGLGLSVSSDLIEMMNGKIEIQPNPDKGSEFIISIPEGISIQNSHSIATDGNSFLFDDGEEF